MKAFEVIELNKDWSTHLPVLIKLISMTPGDVLEIGTGIYSTPFLHWACFLQKRNLVSVENNEEFIKFVRQFATENHQIQKEIPTGKEWNIVFIDSFPLEDRVEIAKQFANSAQYIVVHDTNDDYGDIFKYRFDYEEQLPRTSVFSNCIDVSRLEI